jgi:glycosyltransferase involved in cell wall biosynthesis
MRVALFLPNLGGGGAERVFALLAEGLAARGIDTEVVLVHAEGPHLAAVQAVVPVVDLHVGRTRHSLLPLARYLRRRRPDVLVTALDHANIVAVWARKLARVETAVVITHHLAVAGLPTSSSSPKAKLWSGLRARFYPWADAIVVVSRDTGVDLARALGVPRERVDVILNPVITTDLVALGAVALEHPWFAAGQPPVLIGIGRLERQKDFPTLIRAYAHLRQQRPARLMILGEGTDRHELEALVRELGVTDDVALPGFVDNPYAYLARAAAFVLSSIYEGLPTVVIEALALGTPVVSTDCRTGPREILEDGQLGRLVPIRDSEALAAAIAATLDEPRAPVPAERLRAYRDTEAVDNYVRLFGRVLAARHDSVATTAQNG